MNIMRLKIPSNERLTIFNSFSVGMLNAIMLVVREAEYNARYTLAAEGGEFRPSPYRP